MAKKGKYKIEFYLPTANDYASKITYYSDNLEWKDGSRLKFIENERRKIIRLVGTILVEEQ